MRQIRRNIGLIIVIVFIVLTLLLVAFVNNVHIAFNPPYLRLVLNAVFISATNIFVAIVSVRSFVRHGQISFALLSGALVVSGSAAFMSGWVSGISPNATFTIFNVGFFISSIMQAFGSIYLLAASPSSKVFSNRKIIITLILVASLFSIALLTALSLLGLTSPFVDQNGNTTDLRQFVIGLSFIFFTMSSLAFGYQYVRTKARALYWYSLALALFALDTFVSYNSAQLGDALQWIGRISDYVGGVFFIIALLTLRQQAFVGADVPERWFEIVSNNRAQLANLFSNMLSGFSYMRVLLDKNGNAVDAIFLEVNDTFESNTGLNKKDIIGKRLTEVIPGISSDPANWIGFFGQVATKGEPAKAENYVSELKRWLRVSAYSPERGYVALLVDDVTEPRELQRQLEDYSKNLERIVEERTKQLRASERMAAIGQTAGMVGHDIRNPLQAITGDLYLIEQEISQNPKCLSPDIAESIAAINENIAYINKIVSDLQDYTRTLKPTMSTVNLNGVISSALSGRRIPKNITVELPINDLQLKTDPTLLRRIITNLVTNAIQAMPNGGTLEINTNTEKNFVFISIEDTGVGIPKEAQANLFKPLFTTKAKGQGLGLAVVKRLIEILNGKITFESQEGKGTKFVIELPVSNN